MKTLLSIITLLTLIVRSFSQDPPPPISNCMTNLHIVITATNAMGANGTNTGPVFNGGDYANTAVYCHEEGVLFVFSYAGCPTTDTIIGYYTWECDMSRTCPGGVEGTSEPCGPGGSKMIRMPAYTTEFVGVFRTYLCCDVELCVFPTSICSPPAPSQTNNVPEP